MDYAKTLQDICVELVNSKDRLEVREMPALEENTIVLHVYADHDDIARLIGKRGTMANSIRRLMSVPGRMNDKHIDIKFESYDE